MEKHLKLNLPGGTLILPFDVAQHNSQLLANLIQFNAKVAGGVYAFSFTAEHLPEPLNEQSAGWLRRYVSFLFGLEPLPELAAPVDATPELQAAFTQNQVSALTNAIEAARQLECREEMCQRLAMLITNYFEIIELGTLPPVETLFYYISFAPMVVIDYLKHLMNQLYESDQIDAKILNYVARVIARDQQLAYALQPHGYPFTQRQRIDSINPNLFLLDPLQNTKPLVPDYMGAQPVIAIPDDTYLPPPPPQEGEEAQPLQTLQAPEAQVPPPTEPIILPSPAVMVERLLSVSDNLLRVNQDARRQLANRFPVGDVGYVLSGELFPIILDDWAYARFQPRVQMTFHIYGPTQESRVRFRNELWEMINADDRLTARIYKGDFILFRNEAGMDETSHIFRLRMVPYQTAMEVLSYLPLSSMQIGYDIHRGLICTPAFSLYYRRRVSVVMTPTISLSHLTRTAFRGLTICLIEPYAQVVHLSTGLEEAQSSPDLVLDIEYATGIVLTKGRMIQLERMPIDADDLDRIRGEEFLLIPFGGEQVFVDRWNPHLIDGPGEGDWEIKLEILDLPPICPKKLTLSKLIQPYCARLIPTHNVEAITTALRNGRVLYPFLPESVWTRLFIRNCLVQTKPQYEFPTRPPVFNGTHIKREFSVARTFAVAIDRNRDRVVGPAYYQGIGVVPVAGTIPAPGPLLLPELLAPGEAEYPIHLSGILQLRTQTGETDMLPEDLHAPLDVDPATLPSLEVRSMTELTNLIQALRISDTKFLAEALAYQKILQEFPGEQYQAIRGKYQILLSLRKKEFLPQAQAEQAKLPLYIRLEIDVLLPYWMFIDEGNWLMTAEQAFRQGERYNCIVDFSELIVGRDPGGVARVMSAYRQLL
jgi:hypothetical protein